MNISLSSLKEWLVALTSHELFNDAVAAALIYSIAWWLFLTTYRIKRYSLLDYDGIATLKNRLITNAFITGLISVIIILILDLVAAISHDNHLLSLFLFPILGLIVSTFIDYKFFTGKIIEQIDSQISTLNNDSFRKDEELRSQFLEKMSDGKEFIKISDNDLNSGRLKSKLRLSIEQLQIITGRQQEQIDNIDNNLKDIKDSLLADRALELVEEIYIALGMGYTTPELDRRIKSKYYSYHKLGGNGQIKELKEKYDGLSIRTCHSASPKVGDRP